MAPIAGRAHPKTHIRCGAMSAAANRLVAGRHHRIGGISWFEQHDRQRGSIAPGAEHGRLRGPRSGRRPRRRDRHHDRPADHSARDAALVGEFEVATAWPPSAPVSVRVTLIPEVVHTAGDDESPTGAGEPGDLAEAAAVPADEAPGEAWLPHPVTARPQAAAASKPAAAARPRPRPGTSRPRPGTSRTRPGTSRSQAADRARGSPICWNLIASPSIGRGLTGRGSRCARAPGTRRLRHPGQAAGHGDGPVRPGHRGRPAVPQRYVHSR